MIVTHVKAYPSALKSYIFYFSKNYLDSSVSVDYWSPQFFDYRSFLVKMWTCFNKL